MPFADIFYMKIERIIGKNVDRERIVSFFSGMINLISCLKMKTNNIPVSFKRKKCREF